MPLPATDHDILVEIHTKMELLITNGGSKGIIPELQRNSAKHDNQITFWRGALAIIGFSLLILATFFAGHVFGGAHPVVK